MWWARPVMPLKSGTSAMSWVERMPLQVRVENTEKPGSTSVAAVWRAPSFL